MDYLKKLKRLLASAVVITFFTTNTLTPSPLAYASAGIFRLPSFMADLQSPIPNFSIPAELGKVTDRVYPRVPDAPVLIHIQEAHANYDAQKNIQKILEYLSENYQVDLILLEGAGNKLQPELLNFFPNDPALQTSVNDKLLEKGLLTGAEAFLIDHNAKKDLTSSPRPLFPQNPEGVIARSSDAGGTTWQSSDIRARKEEIATRLPAGRRPFSGLAMTMRNKASLFHNKAAEGWGVENADAYRKDRELFRAVYANRKTADAFLETVFQAWEKQANTHLSKETRGFLSSAMAFENTTLTLQGWLEILKNQAAKALNLDLTDTASQVAWPVLVRYFRLRALDGKIDAKKVDEEKAAFFKALEAYPVKAETIKEIQEIFAISGKQTLPVYKTRFAFERLLDQFPADFSFEAYPNLRLAIQQMILMSEVGGENLQVEMKKLTQQITETLAKTDQEKTLVQNLRDYQLLKKLFHLELNREEYQQLLAKFQKTESREQKKETVCLLSSVICPPALWKAAMDFYAGAIERENHMMKRAREIMQERKNSKAVLITGGFHTDGFKEKAVASGSAYAEITPNVGQIRPQDEKNYLRALLGPQVQVAFIRANQQNQDVIARSPREATWQSPDVFRRGTFDGVRWKARKEEIASGRNRPRNDSSVDVKISPNEDFASVMEQSNIAQIPSAAFTFMREAMPRTWRRFLAGRLADVHGSVLASIPNGRAEEFAAGFQRLLAAVARTPHQPAFSRSEMRKSRLDEDRIPLREHYGPLDAEYPPKMVTQLVDWQRSGKKVTLVLQNKTVTGVIERVFLRVHTIRLSGNQQIEFHRILWPETLAANRSDARGRKHVYFGGEGASDQRGPIQQRLSHVSQPGVSASNRYRVRWIAQKLLGHGLVGSAAEFLKQSAAAHSRSEARGGITLDLAKTTAALKAFYEVDSAAKLARLTNRMSQHLRGTVMTQADPEDSEGKTLIVFDQAPGELISEKVEPVFEEGHVKNAADIAAVILAVYQRKRAAASRSESRDESSEEEFQVDYPDDREAFVITGPDGAGESFKADEAEGLDEWLSENYDIDVMPRNLSILEIRNQLMHLDAQVDTMIEQLKGALNPAAAIPQSTATVTLSVPRNNCPTQSAVRSAPRSKPVKRPHGRTGKNPVRSEVRGKAIDDLPAQYVAWKAGHPAETPITVQQLSPASLVRYAEYMAKGFQGIPGSTAIVHTILAGSGLSESALIQKAENGKADITFVQLHGSYTEKPIAAGRFPGKVVVLIHRPEEFLDRNQTKEDRDRFLAAADALVLLGPASLETYQKLYPEKIVTAIPHGYFETGTIDYSRLESGAIATVGSITVWDMKDMRHIPDALALIEQIKNKGQGLRILGYLGHPAITQDRLKSLVKDDLTAYQGREDLWLLNNAELEQLIAEHQVQNAKGFQRMIYEQSIKGGKSRTIIRTESAVRGSSLAQWEAELIDFNLQLYREVTKGGIAKVEYSGALHSMGVPAIYVVLDSPAMNDVADNEGLQIVQVPITGATIDYRAGAEAILRLIRNPAERRVILETNRDVAAKLGMDTIAFAYDRLFRELLARSEVRASRKYPGHEIFLQTFLRYDGFFLPVANVFRTSTAVVAYWVRTKGYQALKERLVKRRTAPFLREPTAKNKRVAARREKIAAVFLNQLPLGGGPWTIPLLVQATHWSKQQVYDALKAKALLNHPRLRLLYSGRPPIRPSYLEDPAFLDFLFSRQPKEWSLLKPAEKKLLRRYFGLNGSSMHTQAELREGKTPQAVADRLKRINQKLKSFYKIRVWDRKAKASERKKGLRTKTDFSFLGAFGPRLNDGGIKTVERLAATPDQQILGLDGMGASKLKKIKQFLKAFDLAPSRSETRQDAVCAIRINGKKFIMPFHVAEKFTLDLFLLQFGIRVKDVLNGTVTLNHGEHRYILQEPQAKLLETIAVGPEDLAEGASIQIQTRNHIAFAKARNQPVVIRVADDPEQFFLQGKKGKNCEILIAASALASFHVYHLIVKDPGWGAQRLADYIASSELWATVTNESAPDPEPTAWRFKAELVPRILQSLTASTPTRSELREDENNFLDEEGTVTARLLPIDAQAAAKEVAGHAFDEIARLQRQIPEPSSVPAATWMARWRSETSRSEVRLPLVASSTPRVSREVRSEVRDEAVVARQPNNLKIEDLPWSKERKYQHAKSQLTYLGDLKALSQATVSQISGFRIGPEVLAFLYDVLVQNGFSFNGVPRIDSTWKLITSETELKPQDRICIILNPAKGSQFFTVIERKKYNVRVLDEATGQEAKPFRQAQLWDAIYQRPQVEAAAPDKRSEVRSSSTEDTSDYPYNYEYARNMLATVKASVPKSFHLKIDRARDLLEQAKEPLSRIRKNYNRTQFEQNREENLKALFELETLLTQCEAALTSGPSVRNFQMPFSIVLFGLVKTHLKLTAQLSGLIEADPALFWANRSHFQSSQTDPEMVLQEEIFRHFQAAIDKSEQTFNLAFGLKIPEAPRIKIKQAFCYFERARDLVIMADAAFNQVNKPLATTLYQKAKQDFETAQTLFDKNTRLILGAQFSEVLTPADVQKALRNIRGNLDKIQNRLTGLGHGKAYGFLTKRLPDRSFDYRSPVMRKPFPDHGPSSERQLVNRIQQLTRNGASLTEIARLRFMQRQMNGSTGFDASNPRSEMVASSIPRDSREVRSEVRDDWEPTNQWVRIRYYGEYKPGKGRPEIVKWLRFGDVTQFKSLFGTAATATTIDNGTMIVTLTRSGEGEPLASAQELADWIFHNLYLNADVWDVTDALQDVTAAPSSPSPVASAALQRSEVRANNSNDDQPRPLTLTVDGEATPYPDFRVAISAVSNADKSLPPLLRLKAIRKVMVYSNQNPDGVPLGEGEFQSWPLRPNEQFTVYPDTTSWTFYLQFQTGEKPVDPKATRIQLGVAQNHSSKRAEPASRKRLREAHRSIGAMHIAHRDPAELASPRRRSEMRGSILKYALIALILYDAASFVGAGYSGLRFYQARRNVLSTYEGSLAARWGGIPSFQASDNVISELKKAKRALTVKKNENDSQTYYYIKPAAARAALERVAAILQGMGLEASDSRSFVDGTAKTIHSEVMRVASQLSDQKIEKVDSKWLGLGHEDPYLELRAKLDLLMGAARLRADQYAAKVPAEALTRFSKAKRGFGLWGGFFVAGVLMTGGTLRERYAPRPMYLHRSEARTANPERLHIKTAEPVSTGRQASLTQIEQTLSLQNSVWLIVQALNQWVAKNEKHFPKDEKPRKISTRFLPHFELVETNAIADWPSRDIKRHIRFKGFEDGTTPERRRQADFITYGVFQLLVDPQNQKPLAAELKQTIWRFVLQPLNKFSLKTWWKILKFEWNTEFFNLPKLIKEVRSEATPFEQDTPEMIADRNRLPTIVDISLNERSRATTPIGSYFLILERRPHDPEALWIGLSETNDEKQKPDTRLYHHESPLRSAEVKPIVTAMGGEEKVRLETLASKELTIITVGDFSGVVKTFDVKAGTATVEFRGPARASGSLNRSEVRADQQPKLTKTGILQRTYETLGDKDKEKRLQIIRLLGIKNNHEATPFLVNLLQHSDPEIVVAAVESLTQIGIDQAAEPFQENPQRLANGLVELLEKLKVDGATISGALVEGESARSADDVMPLIQKPRGGILSSASISGASGLAAVGSWKKMDATLSERVGKQIGLQRKFTAVVTAFGQLGIYDAIPALLDAYGVSSVFQQGPESNALLLAFRHFGKEGVSHLQNAMMTDKNLAIRKIAAEALWRFLDKKLQMLVKFGSITPTSKVADENAFLSIKSGMEKLIADQARAVFDPDPTTLATLYILLGKWDELVQMGEIALPVMDDAMNRSEEFGTDVLDLMDVQKRITEATNRSEIRSASPEPVPGLNPQDTSDYPYSFARARELLAETKTSLHSDWHSKIEGAIRLLTAAEQPASEFKGSDDKHDFKQKRPGNLKALFELEKLLTDCRTALASQPAVDSFNMPLSIILFHLANTHLRLTTYLNGLNADRELFQAYRGYFQPTQKQPQEIIQEEITRHFALAIEQTEEAFQLATMLEVPQAPVIRIKQAFCYLKRGRWQMTEAKKALEDRKPTDAAESYGKAKQDFEKAQELFRGNLLKLFPAEVLTASMPPDMEKALAYLQGNLSLIAEKTAKLQIGAASPKPNHVQRPQQRNRNHNSWRGNESVVRKWLKQGNGNGLQTNSGFAPGSAFLRVSQDNRSFNRRLPHPRFRSEIRHLVPKDVRHFTNRYTLAEAMASAIAAVTEGLKKLPEAEMRRFAEEEILKHGFFAKGFDAALKELATKKTPDEIAWFVGEQIYFSIRDASEMARAKTLAGNLFAIQVRLQRAFPSDTFSAASVQSESRRSEMREDDSPAPVPDAVREKYETLSRTPPELLTELVTNLRATSALSLVLIPTFLSHNEAMDQQLATWGFEPARETRANALEDRQRRAIHAAKRIFQTGRMLRISGKDNTVKIEFSNHLPLILHAAVPLDHEVGGQPVFSQSWKRLLTGALNTPAEGMLSEAQEHFKAGYLKPPDDSAPLFIEYQLSDREPLLRALAQLETQPNPDFLRATLFSPGDYTALVAERQRKQVEHSAAHKLHDDQATAATSAAIFQGVSHARQEALKKQQAATTRQKIFSKTLSFLLVAAGSLALAITPFLIKQGLQNRRSLARANEAAHTLLEQITQVYPDVRHAAEALSENFKIRFAGTRAAQGPLMKLLEGKLRAGETLLPEDQIMYWMACDLYDEAEWYLQYTFAADDPLDPLLGQQFQARILKKTPLELADIMKAILSGPEGTYALHTRLNQDREELIQQSLDLINRINQAGLAGYPEKTRRFLSDQHQAVEKLVEVHNRHVANLYAHQPRHLKLFARFGLIAQEDLNQLMPAIQLQLERGQAKKELNEDEIIRHENPLSFLMEQHREYLETVFEISPELTPASKKLPPSPAREVRSEVRGLEKRVVMGGLVALCVLIGAAIGSREYFAYEASPEKRALEERGRVERNLFVVVKTINKLFPQGLAAHYAEHVAKGEASDNILTKKIGQAIRENKPLLLTDQIKYTAITMLDHELAYLGLLGRAEFDQAVRDIGKNLWESDTAHISDLALFIADPSIHLMLIAEEREARRAQKIGPTAHSPNAVDRLVWLHVLTQAGFFPEDKARRLETLADAWLLDHTLTTSSGTDALHSQMRSESRVNDDGKPVLQERPSQPPLPVLDRIVTVLVDALARLIALPDLFSSHRPDPFEKQSPPRRSETRVNGFTLSMAEGGFITLEQNRRVAARTRQRIPEAAQVVAGIQTQFLDQGRQITGFDYTHETPSNLILVLSDGRRLEINATGARLLSEPKPAFHVSPASSAVAGFGAAALSVPSSKRAWQQRSDVRSLLRRVWQGLNTTPVLGLTIAFLTLGVLCGKGCYQIWKASRPKAEVPVYEMVVRKVAPANLDLDRFQGPGAYLEIKTQIQPEPFRIVLLLEQTGGAKRYLSFTLAQHPFGVQSFGKDSLIVSDGVAEDGQYAFRISLGELQRLGVQQVTEARADAPVPLELSASPAPARSEMRAQALAESAATASQAITGAELIRTVLASLETKHTPENEGYGPAMRKLRKILDKNPALINQPLKSQEAFQLFYKWLNNQLGDYAHFVIGMVSSAYYATFRRPASVLMSARPSGVRSPELSASPKGVRSKVYLDMVGPGTFPSTAKESRRSEVRMGSTVQETLDKMNAAAQRILDEASISYEARYFAENISAMIRLIDALEEKFYATHKPDLIQTMAALALDTVSHALAVLSAGLVKSLENEAALKTEIARQAQDRSGDPSVLGEIATPINQILRPEVLGLIAYFKDGRVKQDAREHFSRALSWLDAAAESLFKIQGLVSALDLKGGQPVEERVRARYLDDLQPVSDAAGVILQKLEPLMQARSDVRRSETRETVPVRLRMMDQLTLGSGTESAIFRIEEHAFGDGAASAILLQELKKMPDGSVKKAEGPDEKAKPPLKFSVALAPFHEITIGTHSVKITATQLNAEPFDFSVETDLTIAIKLHVKPRSEARTSDKTDQPSWDYRDASALTGHLRSLVELSKNIESDDGVWRQMRTSRHLWFSRKKIVEARNEIEFLIGRMAASGVSFKNKTVWQNLAGEKKPFDFPNEGRAILAEAGEVIGLWELGFGEKGIEIRNVKAAKIRGLAQRARKAAAIQEPAASVSPKSARSEVRDEDGVRLVQGLQTAIAEKVVPLSRIDTAQANQTKEEIFEALRKYFPSEAAQICNFIDTTLARMKKPDAISDAEAIKAIHAVLEPLLKDQEQAPKPTRELRPLDAEFPESNSEPDGILLASHPEPMPFPLGEGVDLINKEVLAVPDWDGASPADQPAFRSALGFSQTEHSRSEVRDTQPLGNEGSISWWEADWTPDRIRAFATDLITLNPGDQELRIGNLHQANDAKDVGGISFSANKLKRHEKALARILCRLAQEELYWTGGTLTAVELAELPYLKTAGGNWFDVARILIGAAGLYEFGKVQRELVDLARMSPEKVLTAAQPDVTWLAPNQGFLSKYDLETIFQGQTRDDDSMNLVLVIRHQGKTVSVIKEYRHYSLGLLAQYITDEIRKQRGHAPARISQPITFGAPRYDMTRTNRDHLWTYMAVEILEPEKSQSAVAAKPAFQAPDVGRSFGIDEIAGEVKSQTHELLAGPMSAYVQAGGLVDFSVVLNGKEIWSSVGTTDLKDSPSYWGTETVKAIRREIGGALLSARFKVKVQNNEKHRIQVVVQTVAQPASQSAVTVAQPTKPMVAPATGTVLRGDQSLELRTVPEVSRKPATELAKPVATPAAPQTAPTKPVVSPTPGPAASPAASLTSFTDGAKPGELVRRMNLDPETVKRMQKLREAQSRTSSWNRSEMRAEGSFIAEITVEPRKPSDPRKKVPEWITIKNPGGADILLYLVSVSKKLPGDVVYTVTSAKSPDARVRIRLQARAMVGSITFKNMDEDELVKTAILNALPKAGTGQIFSNRTLAELAEQNKKLLSQRSETRDTAVTIEQFLKWNVEFRGGNPQGFRGVTEKLTDGVWSLAAHDLNSVEVVAAFFGISLTRADKVMDLTAQPQTLFEKARRTKALSALGLKTPTLSDGLVLGETLAFQDGALIARQKLFGNIPTVILGSYESLSSADRALFDDTNAQLAKAHQLPIRIAPSLDEARKLLSGDLKEVARLRGLKQAPQLTLKALANVSDALATTLKQQLGDNATLVTSRRFRIALDLAGVTALVESLQKAHLATSRSA